MNRGRDQTNAYVVHHSYLATLYEIVRDVVGRMSVVDAAHSRGLGYLWREWQHKDLWWARHVVPLAPNTVLSAAGGD